MSWTSDVELAVVDWYDTVWSAPAQIKDDDGTPMLLPFLYCVNGTVYPLRITYETPSLAMSVRQPIALSHIVTATLTAAEYHHSVRYDGLTVRTYRRPLDSQTRRFLMRRLSATDLRVAAEMHDVHVYNDGAT